MKLKIISLCLLFVTAFLSCKKEDLSSTVNPANTAISVLSKVLVDNQSANEYVYDASNLLTEEKSKFDFTSNHYNGNGQLISSDYYGNDDILSSDAQVFQTAMNNTVWVSAENGVKCGTMLYEYNATGQLIKSTYSRPLSTSSEYSVFSYDANNKINKQTMYWENNATGYIDYSYDAKGNLTKEMLYNLPSSGAAAELITTSQYAFDSEQNPYKSTSKLKIPGINTNQNNVIKETYTIHLAPEQGTDQARVTETTYKYNGLGYPVTKNANVSYVYK